MVWSVDGSPAVVLLESAGGGGRGLSHGSLALGTGLRSSAVELVEWEVEGPSSSRITSEITLNPEKKISSLVGCQTQWTVKVVQFG